MSADFCSPSRRFDLPALIVDALQIERDADAVGGGRAAIIVEDGTAHAAVAYSSARKGATTSGGTRIGRPDALSMIAQWVCARTHGFPSGAGELDVAVEPRALRRLADPGPRRDPVAVERGAEIIDLVPHHDPVISILVRRRRRPLSQCATATCWIHCTHTALLTWPSSSMCSGPRSAHFEDGAAHSPSCVSMNA